MGSMNRVYLMGNLTKDPEMKQLQAGTVGNLRMAISEKYKDKSGELKERVCYVDVVVWGRQAETCSQYLQKGSPLLVEGSLQYEEWEKDGQKRNALKVRADNVQFVGGPKDDERDSGDVHEPASGQNSRAISKKHSEEPEADINKYPEPPF